MQRTKYIIGSIKWGDFAHTLMSIGVPLTVLLFVRLELAILALGVVAASKWRVMAVQPRHWLANIRANSPDFIVNVSFVIMLMRAESIATNILWTGLYIGWLTWLKPQSNEILVGVQSLVTQFLGLSALFWVADDLPEFAVVGGAWVIGLSASRHFLSHFEESMIRVISYGWALIVAQLSWLMNRWLVIYPISNEVVIPQIAVVVTLLSYAAGSLYYLHHHGVLKKSLTRQYIGLTALILGAILWLTDWDFSL